MEKYIPLDALVAEIEKRKKEWSYGSSAEAKYKVEAYKELIEWLNTLDAKEVDLEKEIGQSFIDLNYHLDAYNRVEDYVGENIDMVEYKRIAKYFFELRLKAQKGE